MWSGELLNTAGCITHHKHSLQGQVSMRLKGLHKGAVDLAIMNKTILNDAIEVVLVLPLLVPALYTVTHKLLIWKLCRGMIVCEYHGRSPMRHPHCCSVSYDDVTR
jgi:hypothetical protein